MLKICLLLRYFGAQKDLLKHVHAYFLGKI